MTHTIRFLDPVSETARRPLACGGVIMGAVFPPAGSNPGRNPWAWRLFYFGDQPAREGRAKDEDTAKGHLMAALAMTLAHAGLRPDPAHVDFHDQKVGCE